MKTEIKENWILKDRGFDKNLSDLPYCLENGVEYYVGVNGKHAAISCLLDESLDVWSLDKNSIREMSLTAKTKGIETVAMYTNYGLDIHSKHETPKMVGIDRLIKINADGFNSY
jgi:hypothetical protein